MIKKSIWTDELVAKLEDLYFNKRYSVSKIAEELGSTKNSVISKIHRMELNSKRDNLDKKAVAKKAKLKVQKDSTTIASKTKRIVKDTAHATSKKKIGKYLLEELTNDMCAWPYGEDEFTFCGDRVVNDQNYCAKHIEQMYLIVKRSLSTNNKNTKDTEKSTK